MAFSSAHQHQTSSLQAHNDAAVEVARSIANLLEGSTSRDPLGRRDELAHVGNRANDEEGDRYLDREEEADSSMEQSARRAACVDAHSVPLPLPSAFTRAWCSGHSATTFATRAMHRRVQSAAASSCRRTPSILGAGAASMRLSLPANWTKEALSLADDHESQPARACSPAPPPRDEPLHELRGPAWDSYAGASRPRTANITAAAAARHTAAFRAASPLPAGVSGEACFDGGGESAAYASGLLTRPNSAASTRTFSAPAVAAMGLEAGGGGGGVVVVGKGYQPHVLPDDPEQTRRWMQASFEGGGGVGKADHHFVVGQVDTAVATKEGAICDSACDAASDFAPFSALPARQGQSSRSSALGPSPFRAHNGRLRDGSALRRGATRGAITRRGVAVRNAKSLSVYASQLDACRRRQVEEGQGGFVGGFIHAVREGLERHHRWQSGGGGGGGEHVRGGGGGGGGGRCLLSSASSPSLGLTLHRSPWPEHHAQPLPFDAGVAAAAEELWAGSGGMGGSFSAGALACYRASDYAAEARELAAEWNAEVRQGLAQRSEPLEGLFGDDEGSCAGDLSTMIGDVTASSASFVRPSSAYYCSSDDSLAIDALLHPSLWLDASGTCGRNAGAAYRPATASAPVVNQSASSGNLLRPPSPPASPTNPTKAIRPTSSGRGGGGGPRWGGSFTRGGSSPPSLASPQWRRANSSVYYRGQRVSLHSSTQCLFPVEAAATPYSVRTSSSSALSYGGGIGCGGPGGTSAHGERMLSRLMRVAGESR